MFELNIYDLCTIADKFIILLLNSEKDDNQYPVTNFLVFMFLFFYYNSTLRKNLTNEKYKMYVLHKTVRCGKGYRDAIVAYLLILTQFFRRLKNPCIRCRRIFPFKTKYIELFLALFQSTKKIF